MRTQTWSAVLLLALLSLVVPSAAPVRGAPQQQPTARITLVVQEADGVRRAPGLLNATRAAGMAPAAMCLPLDTLATADAVLRQELASTLGPALQANAVPACLLIRPATAADLASDDTSAGRLERAVSQASAALGAQTRVGLVQLDLSGLAPDAEVAGDFTRMVGRLAQRSLPGAEFGVTLGRFAGVDEGRPSGRSAHILALRRWHDALHAHGDAPSPPISTVSVNLDGRPSAIVALTQDWLQARGLATGGQLAAQPDASERALRPLLLAGGQASALVVTLGSADADRAAPTLSALGQVAASQPLPRVELTPAADLALPGLVRHGDLHADWPDESHSADSNSPAHWWNGELYLFTSVGWPRQSVGPSLESQGGGYPVRMHGSREADTAGGMRWLEATYLAQDGTLYGWYHEEPAGVCASDGPVQVDPDLPRLPLADGQLREPAVQGPARQSTGPSVSLTAPRIGALVSSDQGGSWRDLGIVLETPEGAVHCGTGNTYFAGGVGDFSVLADREDRYLYFLYTAFGPELSEQGIGVARIARADLDNPVDRVWRWSDRGWTEPGVGGRGAMVYPATVDWHRGEANAFWGPTVHWNTHLERFVVLLNRAGNGEWVQEGSYVAYADRLDDPASWSVPQKLRSGGDWYAELIGTDAARQETDKLIGRRARYFERGVSRHEAVFHRPDE